LARFVAVASTRARLPLPATSAAQPPSTTSASPCGSYRSAA